MEDGYKTCSYSDIEDWGLVLLSILLGIMSSSHCVLWKGLKDVHLCHGLSLCQSESQRVAGTRRKSLISVHMHSPLTDKGDKSCCKH